MKNRIIRQRGIFHHSFTGKDEFIARTRECQALARKLFPAFILKDEELPIVFTLSGRSAGMAKRRGNIYNIEFNVEAIYKDREEMLNNTIPHEMAHIVDMFIHGGSSSHGPRWKAIAHSLGCDLQRTHSIPLTKARRTKRYQYIASCGSEVEIGTRHHRMVQHGGKLQVKKTGGFISKKNFTGRIMLK